MADARAFGTASRVSRAALVSPTPTKSVPFCPLARIVTQKVVLQRICAESSTIDRGAEESPSPETGEG